MAENVGSEAQLQLFLHVCDNLPQLAVEVSVALCSREESSSQGNSQAQYVLGLLYVKGDLASRSSDGARLLDQAAKDGDAQAQYWEEPSNSSQVTL